MSSNNNYFNNNHDEQLEELRQASVRHVYRMDILFEWLDNQHRLMQPMEERQYNYKRQIDEQRQIIEKQQVELEQVEKQLRDLSCSPGFAGVGTGWQA